MVSPADKSAPSEAPSAGPPARGGKTGLFPFEVIRTALGIHFFMRGGETMRLWRAMIPSSGSPVLLQLLILSVLAVTLCGVVAPAFAQNPGGSLQGFRASLDPQVFKRGGYGPFSEPLGPIFEQAAAQYNVPRELLLTLGWFGSAFENRGSQPTIEYGYGVMALRQNNLGGNSLELAAGLLGVSVDLVKSDPRLNIIGAAAVLDAYAAQANVDRSGGLDAWYQPVVMYAGLDEEDSRLFADGVFNRLREGLDVTNTWGETFSFKPQGISVELNTMAKLFVAPTDVTPADGPQPGPDYGPAVWDPAASCNYTATSYTKDTIVIHTIEGTAAGCRSWFKNCNAKVSSQYVVSEAGGVWQCVRESYGAWHAGCLNNRSIGIEHEGYASSSSHPTALYNASALLCRDMCNRRGIPKAHRSCAPGILGHNDVNNCHCGGTHWDPGSGWNWTYFINQINGTPSEPAWAATYTNHSYPATMEAGSTAVAWAEFRNDGTSAWHHCEVRLGTSSPQDRSSPFCTPNNWACADGSKPGCNRPTDVDQWEVTKGNVGRFTFILTAPSTPGTYTEKFKLVREGVTWFGPEITWTITVTASKGNLSGKVTNASTSAAIAGATVTLSGVGSTTTNSSGNYTFSNVNAGTYTVSVSATSFSPASSSVTISAGGTATKDFALTPTDTQAPTAPTGLTANAASQTTVQLSWTASTDNVGVTGYDIRRNGSVIGSSSSTSYTDSTASANTTYTYEVRAKDAVPNYSAWSSPVTVTTPPNPPSPQVVFSDGFNGNLNNWTQQVQNFDYSTAMNRGGLTGAGAAYLNAGGSDQMYHTFTRPFAQAKASGYFYDSKGGWKASVCGNSYRQALSLRDKDNAAAMFLDNEFYNAPDNGKYYYRVVAQSGGVGHTAYATRDPNTDCTGTWVRFETIVTPGAPGAGTTGTAQFKVTDRAGTGTVTVNLPPDFFNWGVGRITLGLGNSSVAEGYWDDISFEATPPGVPVMGQPTVLSATEIRWAFSPVDNNVFGFDVADAAGTVVSPNWPAAGWIGHNDNTWTETGLTPNTQYTRKVRAWNGTLNSAIWSATATAWTLSAPPTSGSVTPSSSSVCLGGTITWTATQGFGPGKVQYYKYAWNQNPTHTFDGSEAIWSAGTIETQATAPGDWYLHIQGFNGEDVANGTYAAPITVNPATTVTTSPVSVLACEGQEASFTVAAQGGELAYQWQKDEVDLTDDGHFTGVTTATLTITQVAAGDIGSYRCVVTGSCGSATSDDAQLTVQSSTVITEQPEPRTACTGAPAGFTVIVEGDGAISYQWQKDGVDLVSDDRVTGADTAALIINQVSLADAGVYRCLVTSECGNPISNEVTLVVNESSVLDLDRDCDVDQDDIILFELCATGPAIPFSDPQCAKVDLDDDSDVDQSDFGLFQRCISGEDIPSDPACGS